MCRVFSPARAVLSALVLNYFRPKAGKRRKGQGWGFEPRWAAAGCQALIGEFETACMFRIPLVAELGTDHIEKAVFMISAWIFSESVGGM